MGETRVDLLHLLEDLRDAYAGSLEETIVTEIVANSLDSGARSIRFTTDPTESTLTVVDDGAGMRRKDLIRYHDLATSSKTRGQGIGFAGVGIKLGLLACEDVITETRRGSQHLATRWSLAGRHKAPWKWIAPPGFVLSQGTGVCLKFQNGLSPLLDGGFVEAALRRCFQPLFEHDLVSQLSTYYRHGVTFEVNGETLAPSASRSGERARLAVCVGRKRKPSAIGYLVRTAAPLAEDQQGVAISTLGKVIKRGWEWLGLVPMAPDRIGGLIEVPDLAAALTLNKGDFVRVGSRGALFLGFRKAIQEAVSSQLVEWGDQREPADPARRRSLRPLERDLEQVLLELTDEFPLLASLVERKAGGQKRLPIEQRGGVMDSRHIGMVSVTTQVNHHDGEAVESSPPSPGGADSGEQAEGSHLESHAPADLPAPDKPGRVQPGRYGLHIRLQPHPDDPELARLIESSIAINQSHPAYRRAVASRSEGYHIALCVALTLANFAAEPKETQNFITTFMTRWGEALDESRSGARRRR